MGAKVVRLSLGPAELVICQRRRITAIEKLGSNLISIASIRAQALSHESREKQPILMEDR